MKGVKLLLFISCVAASSAVYVRHRLKRSFDEFNCSLKNSNFLTSPYGYFQQKLDHFNQDSDEKWDQRYWFNYEHHEKDGPIFLFVSGETASDFNWDTSSAGHWMTYAKELNALCFSLEHRFYGSSWPVNGNMTQHLSIEQALADIANFIKYINELCRFPQGVKWILFGASYPGTLAAWARLTYPDLVHGAVASSAPLLAKAVYGEFYQIVEESLRTYDPKCVESITNATQEFVSLISNPSDVKKDSYLFGSCDQSKDIVKEAKKIFTVMTAIIRMAVQYNDSASFNIPAVCNMMINHNDMKSEVTTKLINFIKQNDDRMKMSWDYQRCSQLGWFLSFNQTPSLLAANYIFPYEDSIKTACGSFFGPNFDVADLEKKVNHTNSIYHGLDINVENLVFIHGSLDPWHKAGLYKKASGALYQTIFINGTSHCADVHHASITDSQELKNARQKILETLKEWL